MLSVAFHTLGCKVNQYDSQAMLEAFENAGYTVVSFDSRADVYVVNTCTVTGTGDKKSLQIARRIRRIHPQSELIIAGCLAQRIGEALLSTGARLVIGTQNRAQIVTLYEKALSENKRICAVTSLADAVFEPLSVCSQDEHTRAVLKIQEGCDHHCTYCIIPSVRGPIRSRSLDDIRSEADRLVEAGYREVILTGIHISSYGRDLPDGTRLEDVVLMLNEVEGLKRIRLGSLEPNLITESFMLAMQKCDKVCPQFHPALQSGCDTVLNRMGRRYNMQMFSKAVSLIRNTYPNAALTTDIISGFPGESEQEHAQTLHAVEEIGFSKLHVFPYSAREGTVAAGFPGQLSKDIKEHRTRELIALGEKMATAFRERFIGTIQEVLFEAELESGVVEGYTREYIRVEAIGAMPGEILLTQIDEMLVDGLKGRIIRE